jgi:SPP1 family predicted phage head-tail adaptor
MRLFKTAVAAVLGFERICKKYIYSELSGGFWAYVRHLSERERYTAKALQMEETILFKITANSKITEDLCIEFGDKTYAIESIDKFEFNKTDYVVRAKEIAPPTFDEVEYDEY